MAVAADFDFSLFLRVFLLRAGGSGREERRDQEHCRECGKEKGE
jgi:hypothetical protein